MAVSRHIDETILPPSAEMPEADVSVYWEVLKPRVMSLVIFTALVGIVAAPGHIDPVLGFAALLFISVGAGASGALNMWYEAELDARMARTKGRPIPSGRIDRGAVLGYGLALSIASVICLGLFLNWVAAGLLAFTIFFYAVVYTVWLKPRTPQNIVIGGLSGALPPVVGWAAVTGSIDLEPAILCAITFLWTPPHFWALSLFTTTDYKAAGIPMLPVVKGHRHTRIQIAVYAVILGVFGVVPYLIGWMGKGYLAIAALLGLGMIVQGFRTLFETEGVAAARGLFKFSLLYLAGIYAAVAAGSFIEGF